MDRKALVAILESHRLWIISDPEGQRADLTGAYLAGADLTGAYLAGANLTGAYLAGANLTGADLGETVCVQTGPLGSRADYLATLWHPSWPAEQTRTGCWRGTLKDLVTRVQAKHGTDRFAQEYGAAIAYHRAILRLAGWKE